MSMIALTLKLCPIADNRASSSKPRLVVNKKVLILRSHFLDSSLFVLTLPWINIHTNSNHVWWTVISHFLKLSSLSDPFLKPIFSFPPCLPLFGDRLLLACTIVVNAMNGWQQTDRFVRKQRRGERECPREGQGEFYLGNINIHPLISSQQNLPHLRVQNLKSLFDLVQQLSNIFV